MATKPPTSSCLNLCLESHRTVFLQASLELGDKMGGGPPVKNWLFVVKNRLLLARLATSLEDLFLKTAAGIDFLTIQQCIVRNNVWMDLKTKH